MKKESSNVKHPNWVHLEDLAGTEQDAFEASVTGAGGGHYCCVNKCKRIWLASLGLSLGAGCLGGVDVAIGQKRAHSPRI